jgi:DNA invertase Pin-like site-specific DNA recombinase
MPKVSPQLGKKIGYIRVSSIDQNIDRQLEGIQLDKVYVDRCSEKNVDRPELQELLKYVRDGDQVFVHSMDRLARNLEDLRRIVFTLNSKQVLLRFIKENLEFNGEETALATLMLNVMGSFAEFERSLIKERQAEGIALARKRGAFKGRKPILNPEQIDWILQQVEMGTHKSKIAKQLGISRGCLYVCLQKKKTQKEIS